MCVVVGHTVHDLQNLEGVNAIVARRWFCLATETTLMLPWLKTRQCWANVCTTTKLTVSWKIFVAPYYQCTFYDLLVMIRQLETPTWFFTLLAADMKWPDMIWTIAKQYGIHYTDEEVAALSFEDRSNWLKNNPVTAARHFQYRLNTLFYDLWNRIDTHWEKLLNMG